MGLALFNNHAAVHENDPVGNVTRKGHLVRHNDHRHLLLGERPDDAQHLAGQLGVERRRRLIEPDNVGFSRERARNCDPLLLSAGELMGIEVHFFAEAHIFE